MAAYDAGSPIQVQHFMKVYAFSKLIGESEACRSIRALTGIIRSWRDRPIAGDARRFGRIGGAY